MRRLVPALLCLCLLTSCGGEAAADWPLVMLAVRDGQPTSAQVVGFDREGTFQGVQDPEINGELEPLEALELTFSGGTTRLYGARCSDSTVTYYGGTGFNILEAEIAFDEPPPDGLYLSATADRLPADWSGRTKESWTADLDGDGAAENCVMTQDGGNWRVLLDEVPLADFMLDDVYAADFLTMPLDVDGDGSFEVVLAIWGHASGVQVWKITDGEPEQMMEYYYGD